MVQNVSASLILQDGTEITSTEIPLYLEKISNFSEYPLTIHFFYSSGCHSCKESREYLHSLDAKNPGIQIIEHNLAYNKENKELFTTYKNKFHNHDIGYPVIFFENVGLFGSSDIIHHTGIVTSWYLDGHN